MVRDLTDDEILEVACKHCEFTPEGNYHLRRYPGPYAIVAVVRECFELAELCRQAEAVRHGVAGRRIGLEEAQELGLFDAPGVTGALEDRNG